MSRSPHCEIARLAPHRASRMVAPHRRSAWPCLGAPVDVVTVYLLRAIAAGDELEEERHHHVAEDAAGPRGGLAVVDPGGLFDDALHARAACLLEGGERLVRVGEIPQALAQLHSVLDGQRGALPGAWRGRVRGVPDDDHPV